MTAADPQSQLMRALSALERSRIKLEAAERERTEQIAIIGVGCRLPGNVTDLDSYWSLLENGIDAVSEMPEGRWNTSACYDKDRNKPGKVYSNAMAVLEGADRFDADFFGISAREAERMDLQQRILLEISFEAIEHAGMSADALTGTATGVFIGICANDFGNRFPIESLDTYSATGRSLATASGRLSYTFGLQGPSLSIDTACSSSLVAVHLACQSLRRGETNLAIAGGVHVTAGAETSVGMAKLNALSPTGRCRAFSADADGYVRGEGCVALILKRLSDAQRDGDRILACIKASAVNQDGRSNGLTAPNGPAQAALLRACLSQAQLQPQDIGYLEAHGTGTELGDPIELRAAASVYGVGREAGEHLWVGSGKTNMGHLEAAAGLAGLLRVVLAIRHATIPPNLHFRAPNPHLDWGTLPLRVPTVPTPFPVNRAGARIAGVSSFGFSGTNAHVLLEQAPPMASTTTPAMPKEDWLLISAASEAALREQAICFARYLRNKEGHFRDVCYTTRFRQSRHAKRIAVIGNSAAEMAERLEAYAQGREHADVLHGQRLQGETGVVAVFPGHGSQWWGMGRELYEAQGAFRRVFDECDKALQVHSGHSGQSVRAALFASELEAAQFDASVVQPVLFALAVALAEHMRSLGIQIRAVVGQSMGEVAAAMVAGALSLDDAARIISARSQLAITVKGGAMGMIELSLAEVEDLIRIEQAAVSVAASNGPTSTLVSGDAKDVSEFIAKLQARHIFCRNIRIDYASHSPFMDPLLEPLKSRLNGISPRESRIPIYSTVTGAQVPGSALTPDYWAANLRQPVLFHPAVASLIGDGYRLFLEVTPKPTLSASIEDTLANADAAGCVVSAMRENEAQHRIALAVAAKLYAHGADIREQDRQARLAELPSYPWQHTTFPLPAHADIRTHEADISSDDILGLPRSISGQAGAWIFEGSLSAKHPIVAEHRVHASAILPGAAFLRMALHAARQLWPAQDLTLADITFENVLALREDKLSVHALQLHFVEEEPGKASWRLSSQEQGEGQRWTEHAKGKMGVRGAPMNGARKMPASMQDRMPTTVAGPDLYDALCGIGLEYGPRFRAVEQIWYTDNEFLARLIPPSGFGKERPILDAFVLDACLHGLAWLGYRNHESVQIPVSISEISVAAEAIAPVWVHGVRSTGIGMPPAGASAADLVLWDEQGRVIAQIRNLRASNPEGAGSSLSGQGQWLHCQEWIEQPLPSEAQAPSGDWMIVAAGCAVSEAWLRQLQQRLNGAELVHWDWDRTAKPEFLQQQLLAWSTASGRGKKSIVYLGRSAGRTHTEENLRPPDTEASIGALHFVQTLLRAFDGADVAQVCFITEGTQTIANGAITHRAALGDASIWGFARALSAEHPELRCRCLDLGPGNAQRQLEILADELLSGSDESEVAWRETRWVGRLARSPLPPEAAPNSRLVQEPYRLEIDKPGVLGSLRLRTAKRCELAPGEVEIEVEAAAINFADVMRAMGFFLAPDEQTVALGSECAGVISHVAPDVSDWRVGQQVVALGEHCFASHVRAKASCVAPLPEDMSATTAAGVPIASMTAWHALKTIASLQAGERVLIHSATGGAGLAAVQLALALGAEVIATAGSESKRQLLRKMGIRHVFDSRSADFAREILGVTQDAGVNVVLNSLSGHGLEQSLRVLASDGWFLELGKRDIYEGGRLPLHHFKKRIRYVAIDLAGLQRERPEKFAALFKQVMAALENKKISPLPTTVFPASKAHEAFQRMAAAQHIGKLILNLQDQQIAVADRSGPAPLFRGTQIITGGLGNLGRALAAWLVEHGARHLVLMSRSAPDANALKQLEGLRHRGADVRTIRVDVGSRAELADQLGMIQSELPPVRGVFHLAGVLRDGLVDGQTTDNFQQVLRPKVGGAWNLHALTSSFDLDHFVLYSSAAALLPSASQSNYAAANAFLDALASYRRGQGLPALSLQWGPFSGVGLAASKTERGARLAERGAASIRVEQSHMYLGIIMKSAASALGVFPLDSSRWFASNPTISSLPRFDLLRDGAAGRPAYRAPSNQLSDAPPAKRLELVRALIQRHAAAVLRVAESTIPPDATFQQIGLDSLTGLELRNRMEGETGLRLSSSVLWRQPSVEALAEFICQRISAPPETAGTMPVPDKQRDEAPAKLADKWFLVARKAEQPRLRIFCLPFLGGLGAVFSGWTNYLPHDVELQALQLPGRPPRHNEPPFENFQTLIDALLKVLPSRLDVPYVLYGHSLGALVSFGLTHALRKAGEPLPQHLFLAAYPAPHLHNPIGDIARLPEPEFVQGLTRLRGIPEQVLGDRELLSVFLPSLRAELELLNSYVHERQEPLNVSATILGGTHDHLVARNELEAWKQHFAGVVPIREIEGGHFFMREAEQDVVNAILSSLMSEQR